MSPREKRFISIAYVLFLGIAIAVLGLYFIPAFPYVTLLIGICSVVFYCHNGDSIYTNLGLNPRRGLGVPPVLRRWWSGRTAGGVLLTAPGRFRSRSHQVDVKYSEAFTRQRHLEPDLYRRDALASETYLFSPRDILMGSYITKEAHAERPRAGKSLGANPNPRELLRERLSRPNHAVHTPNRRLSFTRESIVSTGKFVITPQRHYPLQSGTAAVGVLPPAHWDSFKKKNILSPRNSTTLHSPVTVKIARPDHRPPVLDYAGSPGLGFPPEPTSTERVLKVLKESRKRDVVEEGDGSFTAEQHSKRRRNDSGGSAHSAFEPRLPNGMTPQLVPKPGTLKRATNAVEEAAVKRSRTSSASSGGGGGAPVPGGTPGSTRNSIDSSYSSSRGLGKWKKTLEHGSPLSSPGSSRPPTPERALKKPREEDVQRPSSVSKVTPDKATAHIAANTSKRSPVAKAGVCVSSESTSGGGKRKRRIQLVSSHRQDQIYLPPPPQLGYTVTGKDLDMERKAAMSKIQKSLEDPAPEKPGLPPASQLPSTQTAAFGPAATLSGLLAAPLLAAPLSTAPTAAAPASSVAPVAVINLDPTPTTTTTTASITPQPAALASNPLLEALKAKTVILSSLPSITLGTTVSSSGETQPQKPPPSLSSSQLPQSPPASMVLGQPSSSSSSSAPSAFTQVLNQATKPTAIASPIMSGTSLFGIAAVPPASAPPAYTLPTASGAVSAAGSAANPLLASGFKPIFMATPPTSTAPPPAQESKPTVPTFKPLFGSTGASGAFGASPAVTMATVTMATTTTAAAPTANPTASFGGLNGSRNLAASTLFPGMAGGATASTVPSGATHSTTAQPPPAPLFGAWGASSTTTSMPATNAGGGFQFGASAAAAPPPTTAVAAAAAPSAVTTGAKTNTAFTFGSIAAVPPATTQAPTTQAAAPQNPFGFGQAAAAQTQPTATFGGFAMANASATSAATAPTTQSTFTFAKSAFGGSTAPSAFPGLAPAAAKPFGFGTAATTAAPTPAPAPAAAPAPFSFGAAPASTAAAAAGTFGAPAKPTFGAGSTGFAFGSTAAPAAAVAAAPAAPAFGLSTQTQSAPTSTFTFGSSAPQQAATIPSQPATGGFNFAAAMPSTQFGTPVSSNAAPQMAGYNFGAAATDKPTFGTPTFGQSAAAGPTPFGSPATPIQSFSSPAPPAFGSPATPGFSIGAGSKPSGARQRLQARRQHTRKK